MGWAMAWVASNAGTDMDAQRRVKLGMEIPRKE
jgi:hypothetical protein